MTSSIVKAAFKPIWDRMVEERGKELSRLPTCIKEALRAAMLSLQSEEDRADANDFFDQMYYPRERQQ